QGMKKYFLFLFLVSAIISFGQEDHANESLDRYFAGIPLKESFDKWFQYLLNNPYLGVDSFNERGVYSSFKPGMKGEFPFPGVTHVKILFKKIIYYDSLTHVSADSTNEVTIEGVFPDNKMGKKESIEVFRYLVKSLKVNYKRTAIEYE